MAPTAGLLQALGGEAGCLRLAAAFYGRVAREPKLKRLFPGKSLRCATEEFAAFLVQFLEGDEAQTQSRWWLSLRESHARFRIGPEERAAWLTLMRATLDEAPLDGAVRDALQGFFLESSAYVTGKPHTTPEHRELNARWTQQLHLDALMAAIEAGDDEQAIALAAGFVHRPSVHAGVLARMMQAGRAPLIQYVLQSIPAAPLARFAGRTLLHAAAATGCTDAAALLLQFGVDPDIQDRGSHTPLYSVANGCGTAAGPVIVSMLVAAGANVNAALGVTKATPLHMAARRGHVAIAQTLLASGAHPNLRDRKGDTPLARARNCRQDAMIRLLQDATSR